MNLQSWLSTHHACQGGHEFVKSADFSAGTSPDLPPVGPFPATWETIWTLIPRGDHHAWLLDSFLCPFGGAPHGSCLMLQDRTALPWWQTMAFHLKQNGMPMTIQAYITKMRAEEAGLKIKWKGDVKKARIQAGDDIRKVFGELFLFGAAAAIRMTEIESPSKP